LVIFSGSVDLIGAFCCACAAIAKPNIAPAAADRRDIPSFGLLISSALPSVSVSVRLIPLSYVMIEP
jgi:hypothetical protein